MTDEKIKNKKSFHIKGILILIFLTFVSSLPIAIEELKSNTQIGHILFVGEFIVGSLSGILGSTIISAIITFFVNKFKFTKVTFYKILFYLMFIPVLVNITMMLQ